MSIAWETAMQQIRELKAENERLKEAVYEVTGALMLAVQHIRPDSEHNRIVRDVCCETVNKAKALTASGKEVTEATR